jgi:hypothetical protein
MFHFTVVLALNSIANNNEYRITKFTFNQC